MTTRTNALNREFEDVAAVDAVAEATGSAVDVYGHSYGGFLACGAATPSTKRLEPLVDVAWDGVTVGIDPTR